MRENGQPLLPATGIKRLAQGNATVAVGFIGAVTLKATPATMVSPAGVKGLRFEDEAATANALVPQLRRPGGRCDRGRHPRRGLHRCRGAGAGLFGASTATWCRFWKRLDPSVDVVVSGHTHQAYVCDYGRINPSRPFLLTSAGQYGACSTEVSLRVDTASRQAVAETPHDPHRAGRGIHRQSSQGLVPLNAVVPAYPADPFVQQLVARYKAAAEPLAQRPVGRASAPLLRVRTKRWKALWQSGGRCPVGCYPRAAEGRCRALVHAIRWLAG